MAEIGVGVQRQRQGDGQYLDLNDAERCLLMEEIHQVGITSVYSDRHMSLFDLRGIPRGDAGKPYGVARADPGRPGVLVTPRVPLGNDAVARCRGAGPLPGSPEALSAIARPVRG